jgi:Domain of unknown function (DUF1772)
MVSDRILDLQSFWPRSASLTKPHFGLKAGGCQVLAVLFSLILPVPINNRIMRWTLASLPADWKVQERRWDAYHLYRTLGLVLAFGLLTLSLTVRD